MLEGLCDSIEDFKFFDQVAKLYTNLCEIGLAHVFLFMDTCMYIVVTLCVNVMLNTSINVGLFKNIMVESCGISLTTSTTLSL